MACEDTRQLTEAQRTAGYQQQRTGVPQAVRPFTGRPTIENLLDYINRELVPAVRQTRSAVNETYNQVRDNAPSGNPLQFYFSTETANADPTTGYIRLDAATQDTATTIRVSQTNGRLQDVAAWLDVMAGGATTPLGTVTLFDAINPGRFLRFDLTTMVDQGAYWDLGVTIVESSHDNPFVQDGGVALSFIPAVASSGATVPPGAITPIAANTVLGNPTASSAAPTEIAVPVNSVVGRVAGNIVVDRIVTDQIADNQVDDTKIRNSAGLSVIGRASNSTGDPADITSATARHALITNSAGTAIGWRALEAADLAALADGDKGDITVSGSFLTWTIDNDVVTNEKLRNSNALSVIGRSANSSGDPADIQATAGLQVLQTNAAGNTVGWGVFSLALMPTQASETVLGNISGSTAVPSAVPLANLDSTSIVYDATSHTFQRAALTGDVTASQDGNATTIANDAVTNAKLANMAEATVKGRAVAAGTGDPADLTGTEVGALLRYAVIIDTTSTGTIASYAPTGFTAATTTIRITPPGNVTLRGMALAAGQEIAIRVGRTASFTVTINHEDASASVDTERFNCPGSANLTLRAGEAVLIRNTESRNNIIAAGRASVSDGDYGDITVSSNGTVWNIDAAAVTEVELAASVAGNGLTGGAGTALAVGAGDGIDVGADSVSVDVSDIAGTGLENDGSNNLRIASTAAGAGLTGGSGSALAVGAGTGISVNANDVAVTIPLTDGDKGDITVATSGTVWTIDNGAVTLAKMESRAQSTIIGRAEGAGTGAPQALTAAQVGAIIDGEAFSWAANHTFNAQILLGTQQNETGALPLAITLNETTTRLYILVSGTGDIQTITPSGGATTAGRVVLVYIVGSGTKTIQHAFSGGGVGRIQCPNNVNFVVGNRDSFLLIGDGSNGWLATNIHSSFQALTDGDKGDITVSSSGATWTIDNSAVTLAKMENRAAGTVIGRAIDAGTGAPTALTGAEVGSLARRYWWESTDTTTSGTVNGYALTDKQVQIHFNLASPATIRSFTVQTGKTLEIALENTSAAVTLVNENAGGTLGLIRTPGAVDLVLTGGDACVVTYLNNRWRVVAVSRGAALTDGDKGDITVSSSGATWTIDNNVVSDAKLRDSAALSVIGRSANSLGDPADIAAANDGEVLRRSGTTLGFGTVATAGIANSAVTLAKLENRAQSTFIGRAEGAGTGAPQELTPTQAVAIIDAENVTWTGTHTFNGGSITANVGTADILLGANPGGIGLFSGQATANVTNGDLVLNSASGIAINATASAITTVADGTVRIDSTTEVEVNTTTLDVNVTTILLDATNSSSIAVGGGDLTLAASGAVIVASPLQAAALEGTGPAVFNDTIEVNDSTYLDQTVSWRGIQNSATATLNNFALGNVSVIRLSGTNFQLSGIDPSEAGGQLVLIFNVHETEDASVLIGSTSSTLGNRFAGEGTSRIVRAGEGVIAWYDGTSEVWRLVGAKLSAAS